MSEARSYHKAVVLLAEDNPADQNLTRRALEDARVDADLKIVEDGVEAMAYLRREGAYADPAESPRPDLFLLDINMPRMDGKQVLKEVKADPDLRSVPVVMLTTSQQEIDVLESYNLGVNAYIAKPVDMDQFITAIQNLQQFWLVLAVLPPKT